SPLPGVADDLLEHIEVDVLELVDIEAAGTRPVLAQSGEVPGLNLGLVDHIEGERSLAGRESDHRPDAGGPACGAIVVLAVTDDRRTPHQRLLAGGSPKDRVKSARLVAASLDRNRGQRLLEGVLCGLGLLLGHRSSLWWSGLCLVRRAPQYRNRALRSPHASSRLRRSARPPPRWHLPGGDDAASSQMPVSWPSRRDWCTRRCCLRAWSAVRRRWFRSHCVTAPPHRERRRDY